jgi:methylase of polypeptide subunit release factors
MIYGTANPQVVAQIPSASKHPLDLCRGSGVLGESLKQERGCQVVGFTSSEAETALAEKALDVESSGFFPLPIVHKLRSASLVKSIDTAVAHSVPGLFGYQFVFACRSCQP